MPSPRIILHLDMDAFYASVEQRDRPELRGRPVVVGAAPDQRGVVCAASYEARTFGVRSAMPSVTARRLCPDAVFIRPRMADYQAESREIMTCFAATGGVLQPVSIDEAYLDLTARFGAAEPDPDLALQSVVPFARELKESIRTTRGLTVSIGIAGNKFLAKLASDYDKPDGLILIPGRDKAAFLRPLPVGRIHGVGPATVIQLGRLGIETVADLQDHPDDLRPVLGKWGPELRALAFGEDDRPVRAEREIKSISSENTFNRDTDDRRELRACLWAQARELDERLERKGLAAQTVQVKVRYADFTTLTRQVSVEERVMEAREIYRLAAHLLGRERLVKGPLRLLGLGVSGLCERSARQLTLPLED